jgi:hypothetical protein
VTKQELIIAVADEAQKKVIEEKEFDEGREVMRRQKLLQSET